jgi:hypothetical protein
MSAGKIPKIDDINVHDSLDERVAVKRFLGKDLEEAEALFRKNFLGNSEWLMWMGPRAFCYYVQSAISYIRSDTAAGNSDAPGCLASCLEMQLEWHRSELLSIALSLSELCDYVIDNYPKFEIDQEIYGDVRPRYVGLRKEFRELVGLP